MSQRLQRGHKVHYADASIVGVRAHYADASIVGLSFSCRRVPVVMHPDPMCFRCSWREDGGCDGCCGSGGARHTAWVQACSRPRWLRRG